MIDYDQWLLVYFRVQRSSPLFPFLGGLALRPLPPSLLVGSHPPPPISFFVGFKRLSNLCPARRDDTSSFDASRRCMKLQNPPRLHSPFSFCRQQASLKSVTGESSAYNGRPAYQRSFKLSTAVCASVSHSYRAYTLPIRWSPTLSHTWKESASVDGKRRKDSHAARASVQTWPIHNTGLRIPRRNLLVILVPTVYRRGRERDYGRHWATISFGRREV